MMALAASRGKVLSIFKTLHRTSQSVFVGDDRALTSVRGSINEEFRKHLDISDPVKIEELLKIATEAEELLRTDVIQVKEVRPNVYRVNSEHVKAKCVDSSHKYICDDCTCGRALKSSI